MSTTNRMLCPHCGAAAAFQAEQPVQVLPVVENWQVDSNTGKMPSLLRVVCLECDELADVDVRGRLIRKVARPQPVWNEAVELVVENLRETGEDLISEAEVKLLRRAHYRGIHPLLTGRQALLVIFEQKD
jgi:hypothetical protein